MSDISPSKEDLIESSNHLFYEIKTFDAVSAILFAGKSLVVEHGMMDKTKSNHRQFAVSTVHDALLESFLIHMRNIFEFLFKTKVGKGKDDVIAKFYMEGKNWSAMLEELKRLLPELDPDMLKKRIDTEIVHLSFERNRLTQETKKWPFLDHREKVLGACLVFFRYANQSLFSEKCRGYFEHISKEYSDYAE